jgi:hypothetical protein
MHACIQTYIRTRCRDENKQTNSYMYAYIHAYIHTRYVSIIESVGEMEDVKHMTDAACGDADYDIDEQRGGHERDGTLVANLRNEVRVQRQKVDVLRKQLHAANAHLGVLTRAQNNRAGITSPQSESVSEGAHSSTPTNRGSRNVPVLHVHEDAEKKPMVLASLYGKLAKVGVSPWIYPFVCMYMHLHIAVYNARLALWQPLKGSCHIQTYARILYIQ